MRVGRRSQHDTLYQDFVTARGIAEASRTRNRIRGNDDVADVVALTVITEN
jgi:hypothetical protein